MDVTLPLNEMTIAEKLRLMEALWDDLCRHDDEIEPPAWHLEVLQERQKQAEAGKAVYSDWEEAKDRLFRRKTGGCEFSISPSRTWPEGSIFTNNRTGV